MSFHFYRRRVAKLARIFIIFSANTFWQLGKVNAAPAPSSGDVGSDARDVYNDPHARFEVLDSWAARSDCRCSIHADNMLLYSNCLRVYLTLKYTTDEPP